MNKTHEARAAVLIGSAIAYVGAYGDTAVILGTCCAVVREPSGRIRYTIKGKRSTRADVVADTVATLAANEPTEQARADGLDVVHVDAADIDHAENVPTVSSDARTYDQAPTKKQRRAERVRQNRLRKIERKAREAKAVEAMTDKMNAFTMPGKLRRCGRTLRGVHVYRAENPNRADRIAARLDWHALTGAPASTIASLREQLRLASL